MLNDQIEKYLDGELKGSDLEEFEAAMKNDKNLVAKVKLHQNLPEAILENDVVELEDKMKTIFGESQQMAKVPTAKIFSMRRVLAIAASILLLVVAGWWIIEKTGDQTPEQLFADYINYPTSISPSESIRSTNTDEQSIDKTIQQLNDAWNQTNSQYIAEDPAKTLESLEAIRNLDPDFKLHSRSQYYYALGLTHLQNENPEEALLAFEQVSTNEFKEMADWYQAMALLLLPDRTNEAVSILKMIAATSHPKKAEALEILKKLEK